MVLKILLIKKIQQKQQQQQLQQNSGQYIVINKTKKKKSYLNINNKLKEDEKLISILIGKCTKIKKKTKSKKCKKWKFPIYNTYKIKKKLVIRLNASGYW